MSMAPLAVDHKWKRHTYLVPCDCVSTKHCKLNAYCCLQNCDLCGMLWYSTIIVNTDSRFVMISSGSAGGHHSYSDQASGWALLIPGVPEDLAGAGASEQIICCIPVFLCWGKCSLCLPDRLFGLGFLTWFSSQFCDLVLSIFIFYYLYFVFEWSVYCYVPLFPNPRLYRGRNSLN